VCVACGVTVVPAAGGRWRHLPAGRPYPRRSRWLAPVTWRQLRRMASYQEFTARYPWTVRPDLCGGITTEQDWREGVRRLRAYHAGLAAAGRRSAVRPGENPYADLVAMLAGLPPGADPGAAPFAVPPGLANVLGLAARRRELASVFSWAIPSEGALSVIAGYSPLVECGAGTGYWAALLRGRGADVAAYDIAPPGSGSANEFHRRRRPWTQVLPGTSAAAVAASPGRALLLCWPPRDDDASYTVLRALSADTVLYLGEGPGGATGSERFHQELALNWTPAEQVALPRWPGLRDKLTVYRRSVVRRPADKRWPSNLLLPPFRQETSCLDTGSGTGNASAQATCDRLADTCPS
jgi:hypothetical protein